VIAMTTKTEKVFFRASSEERDDIDEAARKLDLNRSEFLRLTNSLAVRKSDDVTATLLIDATTVEKMFIELNRWGKNYNQGIKALNTIAAKLKRTNFTEEEKSLIALQSKNALETLLESKDGLLNINIQLLSMAQRPCMAVPRRLMLKLGRD
jgi:hypothetical protein